MAIPKLSSTNSAIVVSDNNKVTLVQKIFHDDERLFTSPATTVLSLGAAAFLSRRPDAEVAVATTGAGGALDEDDG